MARVGAQSPGLLFGTAGVPASSRKPDTASGVEAVARLGLGAMELEFVRGVRLSARLAARVRDNAERLGVALTCHGPYYINLNAREAEKVAASEKRILDTARAASLVGARSITFHAAFYLQDDPETVHRRVRERLGGILEQLARENISVQVRPETTGKPSQYGTLEELLRLSRELPGVQPCIDFAHLHARGGGGVNRAAEFRRVLEQVASALGERALSDLHLHVSGIDYGDKGERKHLMLADADFRYRQLLRELKRAGAGGILICESPDPEADALLLQKTYHQVN